MSLAIGLLLLAHFDSHWTLYVVFIAIYLFDSLFSAAMHADK